MLLWCGRIAHLTLPAPVATLLPLSVVLITPAVVCANMCMTSMYSGFVLLAELGVCHAELGVCYGGEVPALLVSWLELPAAGEQVAQVQWSRIRQSCLAAGVAHRLPFGGCAMGCESLGWHRSFCGVTCSCWHAHGKQHRMHADATQLSPILTSLQPPQHSCTYMLSGCWSCSGFSMYAPPSRTVCHAVIALCAGW